MDEKRFKEIEERVRAAESPGRVEGGRLVLAERADVLELLDEVRRLQKLAIGLGMMLGREMNEKRSRSTVMALNISY